MRKSSQITLTLLASAALGGAHCIAAQGTVIPAQQAMQHHDIRRDEVLRGGFGQQAATVALVVGSVTAMFLIFRASGE